MAVSKQCYRCGRENPDQTFCGGCGAPLAFTDYIATVVNDQLTRAIKDRDVLEMDSSIKVFNKAWSWIRLIFGIAVTLLIFTGLGIFWKASDFWSAVGTAKQSVVDTANGSRADIVGVSSNSKQDIATALTGGKIAIKSASDDAVLQSKDLKKSTVQSRTDISKEIVSFQADLAESRKQLQAANQLQPQMADMQKQLAQAVSDIQAQQKVISSSEDFVKSVFSSHVTQTFYIKLKASGARTLDPNNRYAVIPPSIKENKLTLVLLLLDATPIKGTLQLQQQVAVQPPGSYFNFQNLVLFFWGDPASGLEQKPLSVSYFPDKSDKDLVHSLVERDGRVFADQPLPKFTEPDPDFKGNKWIPLATSPARP